MKKSIRVLLFTGFLLLFSAMGWAAYIDSFPLSMSQPDGTKLSLFASGDEYYNWLHDQDGYTVRQNDKGWYVYLDLRGDELVFTFLVAGRDNPARSGLSPWLNVSPQKMGQRRQTRMAEMRATGGSRTPTEGALNNLVIFIRFSDQTEFGQNLTDYSTMFNGTTGNNMQTYFNEASYNALDISTAFYPVTSTTVVSWQDSHPRSYYSPYNATTNPSGYTDDTVAMTREHTLLSNAVVGVRSQIPAGLSIDGDNDGKVDNVCFIIKGVTDAWANLLWPHQWALYTMNITINSKRVYNYNFQLSEHLASSGNGVLCHEMFHSLGSPDLYHYTSDGMTPVGVWDLMANNTNPPQHMSAYMKYRYGGWIDSVPVAAPNSSFTLNPLTSPANNCYRINSPYNAGEYFMVEFRKKTGTFENSLPAGGLVIYRINSVEDGNGNADGPPDEVYVFRQGGTLSTNGIPNNANFSSEAGRTVFNAVSNPYPFLSNGNSGGITINSVGSSAGATISFTLQTPAQISVSPGSFSQNLAINQTASQVMSIGNSGTETLTYNCSIPTSTVTVLDESFENGGSMPTGWTQQQIFGSQPWTIASGGNLGHPAAAYDGTFNARLLSDETKSKLISPVMNLSGAASATLTFWHAQAYSYSNDYEELRVYYRTTATGNWSQIASMTSPVSNWTQRTYNLSNLSATYYLAFEGLCEGGYGVCLDKVVVTKAVLSAPWLTLNGGNSFSGSIASGQANATVNLGFNSTGLSAGVYSTTLTINSNSGAGLVTTRSVSLTVGAVGPSNLTVIASQTGTVQLNWTAAPGSPTGYKVYAAANPYAVFPGGWTLLGTVTGNQWSGTVGANRNRFYRVTTLTSP